jgi:hypothetical protein
MSFARPALRFPSGRHKIAWAWLRWQPKSALSMWYQRRFGSGNARLRKVGIVALARKLLIALWRYLDQGEIPEGAEFTPSVKKLNGHASAATTAVRAAKV